MFTYFGVVMIISVLACSAIEELDDSYAAQVIEQDLNPKMIVKPAVDRMNIVQLGRIMVSATALSTMMISKESYAEYHVGYARALQMNEPDIDIL
ncbi:unnamed protein product [Strongylus vulgaris]|uniref:Uncharacterized protein n=1 Tax=Strongylus vulgaris TaxID=40348 RepID=A0A3P7L7Z4_STRVU|nr:unnamed protein product [Strongylus vulgaris]